MSAFTTQVRFICEQMYGLDESVGLDRVNEVVSATSGEIIGEYPIFDESYRNVLNDKIIKHYYTREIGEETVGLWRFRLNTKMNEIMPYFNKLYESELLKFNPFYDVELRSLKSGSGEENGEREESRDKLYTDVKNGESKEVVGESGSRSLETSSEGKDVESRTSEGETKQNGNKSGTNSGETSGVSTSNVTDETTKGQLDKYADTPQGSVSGLLDGTYLTNARDITGNEKKDVSGIDSSSARNSGTYSENDETNSKSSGIESGVKDSKVNGEESESSSRDVTKNGESSESGSGTQKEKNKESNRVTSTESYVESVMGKRGNVSYSKMLNEFRETFINIDMLVISELNSLFIGLWE